MFQTTRLTRVFALAILLALPGMALAGPPLICHPFDTGGSPSLPWGDGPGWNTPLATYDVSRLTADTMRLLTSGAPVLARMETMRRATIYAGQDARVRQELLTAVLARAFPSGQTSALAQQDPAALFDAGYLIESYEQAAGIHRRGGDLFYSPAKIARKDIPDGYGLVTRALVLSGGDPEMEYAASLMTEGDASEAHRRRAKASAPSGSLLARNLAR